MTHLTALYLRLANERTRLLEATNANEIELRKVWIKQMEKEIEGEIEFLEKNGLFNKEPLPDMDADELLKELLG